MRAVPRAVIAWRFEVAFDRQRRIFPQIQVVEGSRV
jgi:hypothetical protein